MKRIGLVLLTVTLTLSGVEWSIDQITDNPVWCNDEAMIKIDADGNPLIVFERWEDEGDYDHLMLAYQDNGIWKTEEIMDASGVGWCDFDVDSKGNFFFLHTFHGVPDQTELYLTTDTSGEFSSTVLITKDAWISNTHILLDKEDNPHIIYTEDEPEGWEKWIYYGYIDAEGFNSELVNEDLGSSGCGDLVLDANGSPHVFFTDGEEGGIWHVSRSNDGWTRESVYTNWPWWTFNFPSAVIDEGGYFHVAYEFGGGSGIGYSTNKAGSWVPEWITDTLTDIGMHMEPCVAVDSKNGPHIAWWYYETEESWGDVGYGTRGILGWEYGQLTQTPENDEWMSQTHFFVIDPSGYGHIVFSSWWIEGEVERSEVFHAVTTESLAEPDAISETNTQTHLMNLNVAGSTIHFSLPVSGSVILNLYDASGRRVENLVSGFYPAGEHTIPIPTVDLSTGVYFVRAQIGEYAASAKFVVTR